MKYLFALIAIVLATIWYAHVADTNKTAYDNAQQVDYHVICKPDTAYLIDPHNGDTIGRFSYFNHIDSVELINTIIEDNK